MNTAKGTFEVKVEPLAPDEEDAGVAFGRMSFRKVWQGDFDGTSTGEMLTASTAVDGRMSAGYVAIERMRGKLAGRAGGFVLQHAATMNRGEQALSISVIPDSGTGELAGIAGTVTIEIVDDRHFYFMEYNLPAAPR